MRVFIMTDLEGISCVTSNLVWDSNTSEYREGCIRLMADTNAAVRAAFDAGADEVYVFDGHGSGKNFIPGALDARARHVTDYDEKGIFDGCKAFLLIGNHAKAGTERAFLDHTQSSKNWYNYYINGKTYGELAQEAAYCGAYGVPVVMISGDDAACREAKEMIEGIECAEVKTALGRHSAVALPAEEAERRIYDAALAGIRKAAEIKPFKVSLPAEIKVEYTFTHVCDEVMAHNPRVKRIDGRTVVRIVDKIEKFGDVLP